MALHCVLGVPSFDLHSMEHFLTTCRHFWAFAQLLMCMANMWRTTKTVKHLCSRPNCNILSSTRGYNRYSIASPIVLLCLHGSHVRWAFIVFLYYYDDFYACAYFTLSVYSHVSYPLKRYVQINTENGLSISSLLAQPISRIGKLYPLLEVRSSCACNEWLWFVVTTISCPRPVQVGRLFTVP